MTSGHAPKAEDIHAIDLVTLDATTGEVTGGRALMRAAGFDIGATVAPKQTSPGLPAATCLRIYKILNITEDVHGDFVSLEKLPTGSAALSVSVKVGEFLQLWLRAEAREMVESLTPGVAKVPLLPDSSWPNLASQGLHLRSFGLHQRAF